ncbi:MAG: transglycosylase SLT domain-containing protein [Bacteroidota bacterium]|nr:transglycosylase SLT domain-containing protein [Bacteroidota bacterium]
MKKTSIIYPFARPLLSLALIFSTFSASAQFDATAVSTIERYVVGYNDVTKMKFINDSVLYTEGWDQLAQPKFWQSIMKLSPDSAIVNVASSRSMLDRISIREWNKLSDPQKICYKDSLRKLNGIPDSVTVYITNGKKDFYEFKKVMPTINRSIDVFKQNNVDPWYAQAILLIESPGKMNTKSCVGANGPFQLMKAVARKQGLIVNKTVDERTDIEKSAMGASKLLKRICIPYVRTMLDSAHVPYHETDLWFRLLVLHAYHAGAGNVAGVIKKINPKEGGMELIRTVWQTTYGTFKNSSQNYSQLALAAFFNFDEIVMASKDSVYLIDGDRMLYAYNSCKCTPYDKCTYLGDCIGQYENDLVEGVIPFDYFITKVKSVENELAGLAPFKYPGNDEHFKARKMEDAYKVFKHNEITYPESWSVYHGLGETYRLMGQKDMAIANYKKSLKLNPNAQESQKAMARLSAK